MPKISGLPAGTTPTGAEKFPAVQGAATARFTLSQVYAATKTLTNTTFDTAATGNSLSINGLAATANTGTGSVVRATSPTLVTPALGTPSSVTLTNATGLPIATGVANLGTGIATALAVNVGTAGSPVVNGGVLGTPSSGTATNLTGLPVATGVSGLGTGVATFLATPSSANLATALTDETGTGAAVFATSPSLTTPVIAGITSGTPPAAGKVGEIISNTIAFASRVNAPLNTDTVWNSLSLTAGIWLVGGNVGAAMSAGSMTHMHGDHSTGVALQTTPGAGSTIALHVTINQINGWIFPMGVKPYNVSGATTVNGVAQVEFSGGTAGLYGHMWALRIA